MLPRMTFSWVLAAPDRSRPILGWLLRARTWLRPGWHWLSRYPLLAVMTLVLLLITWGVILTDFDAFHIVWHEKFDAGFAAGMALAIVLGGFWYATFLIDRARAAHKARLLDTSRRGIEWPPYLVWWLVSVIAFAGPAVLPGEWTTEEPWPHGDATRHAFPMGLGTVGFLLTLLVLATEGRKRPRLLTWIAAVGYGATNLLYLALAAFHALTESRFCPIYSTAVNFLLLVGFIGSIYALVLWAAAHWKWVDRMIYPALLSLFVPWLLNLFLAAIALGGLAGALLAGGAPRRRGVLVVVSLVGLALVIVVRPGTRETEHRLPYMHDYYDKPVSLFLADRQPGESEEDWRKRRHAEERKMRTAATELIDPKTRLQSWKAHIARPGGYFPGQTRPAFVVMVSGGASTSALYSARVLFDLETTYPGFGEQIVLISGASGGMVGAAYYVVHCQAGGYIDELRKATKKYFDDAYYPYRDGKKTPEQFQAAATAFDKEVERIRHDFLEGLHGDFLTPLVQKYVFKDMTFNYFQRSTQNDRGRALEVTWNRYLKGAVDPASKKFDRTRPAFDVPVRSLHAAELQGAIPSLVFSPMMIEDGRQLLISNLNLDGLIESESKSVAHPALAAVEFAKLFPEANEFRLGTAVRLNASFPFLSPAASLPTRPARRVVDAGYYDNYGANVALKWIAANEQSLREVCGEQGVKLLPIYTYGYESNMDLLTTAKEDDDPTDPAPGGVFRSATAPVQGLFASWRSNMVYRVEDRIGYLEKWMNRGGKSFLDRIVIRSPADFPMNWYLRQAEIDEIDAEAHAWAAAFVGKMPVPQSRHNEVAQSANMRAQKTARPTKSMPGADAKQIYQQRPGVEQSVDKLIKTMPKK